MSRPDPFPTFTGPCPHCDGSVASHPGEAAPPPDALEFRTNGDVHERKGCPHCGGLITRVTPAGGLSLSGGGMRMASKAEQVRGSCWRKAHDPREEDTGWA